MSATVKIIPTKSTSALIEYVGRVEVSSSPKVDRKRVMFSSGQHCRPHTAAQEFRALREKYGRQGEMRTVHGKYVQEEGVSPTHIKVGKNWRRAKAGEVATHSRIEPAVPFEKASEGYHLIVSFAPDTVNRDDPEQCRRAFEAAEAWFAQDYSGVQATLTGHGDAKGSKDAIERGEDGKFHIHIAANAPIHSEMEINGRIYKPGQRMAGAATNIDTIRERWDRFLETRGHEFGLGPQDRTVLPEVGSKEYREKARRTNQDFWEKERGQISDHDRARRGLETAFAKLAEDSGAFAKLNAPQRMERLADEVAATGDLELKIRTQKDGQKKIRSFVVPDRKQAIGATKLGGRYEAAGINQQLDLIAKGQWKALDPARSGPVKPIPELDELDLQRLQQSIDAMAANELEEQQLDAWLKDWADEDGVSVQELLESKDITGSTADRARLKQWKADWETRNRNTALDQGQSSTTPQRTPEAGYTTVAPEINSLMDQMQQRADGVEITTEPEVSIEPPAESEAEVEQTKVATPQQDQPVTTTTEPQKPRKRQDVGRLTPRQMQDRELIATVHKEHANGGAYVSFELAAHDPVAAGREGLFLHAKAQERADKNGNVRRTVNTWQQLSKSEYAKLRLTADENSTEVDGRKVFGVRGDIAPWGRSGSGYEAAIDSLSASRKPAVDHDVLRKQQQSEDAARTSNLHKKIDDRAAQIELAPHERAFAAVKAREQSRSYDGYDR